MNLNCNSHDNRVDRICVYKGCKSRLMCMLCDHNHVFLPKLRQRSDIQYKKFITKIQQSIDNILINVDHKSNVQNWQSQIYQIQSYFKHSIQIITQQFQHRKLSILKLFTQNDDDDLLSILKSLRMSKKYSNTSDQIFQLLLHLYDGNTIEQKYQQKKYTKLNQIKNVINSNSQLFKAIFNLLNLDTNKNIPKNPQLTIHKSSQQKQNISQPLSNVIIQSQNSSQVQFKPNLITTSNLQFNSIITDAAINYNNYFITSLDKSLKILDHQFNLLKQYQYGNTLEKIHFINNKQFALAISKQISIMNLEQTQVKQLLKLKGHDKKIISIDHLNTRILASSSGNTVRIWDLYKQNQQYYLKDKPQSTQIKFISEHKKILIAYNDWKAKYYDIQTLKLLKTTQLPGIILSSQKINPNIIYVGGYPNNISILDYRSPNIQTYKIGQQAITSFANYENNTLVVGNRSSDIYLFDIRKNKCLIDWKGHQGMSTWSRQNGIVKILMRQKYIVSVSANERNLKMWKVN